MRTFHNTNPGHSKFWECEVVGAVGGGFDARVRWGKIGSVGQLQIKHFGSSWAAEHFCAEKIVEKVSKGYYETNAPKPVPAPAKKPHLMMPAPEVIPMGSTHTKPIEKTFPPPVAVAKKVDDGDDLAFLDVLGL